MTTQPTGNVVVARYLDGRHQEGHIVTLPATLVISLLNSWGFVCDDDGGPFVWIYRKGPHAVGLFKDYPNNEPNPWIGVDFG